MLGGEMAMVEKTAGTRVFHLEVHICTESGAVLTRLKPLIMVDGPEADMMCDEGADRTASGSAT